jgi:phage-related protein
VASASVVAFDILARDHASGVLTKVGKSASSTHSTFGRLSRGVAVLGGAFAGLAVISTATSLLKDSVAEGRESVRVGKQTAAVLKSTGGAAKVTAKHVSGLATALSNKVGIDDEAIQSGENLLLTFTGIRNEAGKGNKIFDRATSSVLDMSAAMGTSTRTSAIQLGKALNDPVKGLASLTRIGVSFSQGQKDQIKHLVDTGQKMKAQKVILRELNKEFGGSAKAQVTPAMKAAVAWGNLKEQIGMGLIPVVDKLATVASRVIPIISKGLTNLGPIVAKVSGAFKGLTSGGGGSFFKSIAAVVVPAFQSLAAVVKTDLLPALVNIWPVVKPLGIFLLKMFGSALVGAFKGAVQAIKGLVQVISGVLNFVSDLIHGRWSKLWGDLGQIVRGAGNLIVGVIKALWNGSILGIFRRGALFLTKGIWVKMWTGLKSLAERGWRQLGNLAGRGMAGMGRLVLAGVKGYFRMWLGLFKGLLGTARAGWRVLRSAFGGAMAAIRTVVAHALGAMRGAFVNFFRLQVGLFRNAWTAARGAVANGVGKVLGLVKGLPGRIAGALGSLGSVLRDAGAALIQGLINGIMSKLRAVGDAMHAVASKVKGFMPGSPVKEGPLTSWNNGGAGKRLMRSLSYGIDAGGSDVAGSMRRVAAAVATTPLDGRATYAATAARAAAPRSAATQGQGLTDSDIDRLVRALERANLVAHMDAKHAVDGMRKHKRQHGGKKLGLD